MSGLRPIFLHYPHGWGLVSFCEITALLIRALVHLLSPVKSVCVQSVAGMSNGVRFSMLQGRFYRPLVDPEGWDRPAVPLVFIGQKYDRKLGTVHSWY